MSSRNLLLLVVLGTLCRGTLAAEDPVRAQADLAAVEQAIASVQAWLDEANRQQSGYESQLREAELAIAALQDELSRTLSDIETINRDLAGLQQSVLELENARLTQQSLAARSLKSAYMGGRQGQLKLLLNQEDPSLAARMQYYYQQFNAARLESIRNYQSTLVALAEARSQLDARHSTLLARQMALSAQQQALDDSLAARQLALDSLRATIAARGEELDKLLADRENLEQLIDRIQEVVEGLPEASGAPFAQRQGQLPWPAPGTLISGFGSPYGDGSLRRQGIIIAGEPGSPVHAVHSGRVVFADWLRGYGLVTIIDHGEGYMSLYGYNQQLTTAPGTRVYAGQVVALSGASGGQLEPGIYFEIRLNGRPQNPLDWCLPLAP